MKQNLFKAFSLEKKMLREKITQPPTLPLNKITMVHP